MVLLFIYVGYYSTHMSESVHYQIYKEQLARNTQNVDITNPQYGKYLHLDITNYNSKMLATAVPGFFKKISNNGFVIDLNDIASPVPKKRKSNLLLNKTDQ